MICKNCGAAVSDGAAFCGKCGSAMKRTCPNPNCRNKVDDGMLFCDKCGTRLGVEIQEAKMPAPTRNLCKLTIRRESQFFLVDMTIKVKMDGKNEMAQILSNDYQTYSVAPGKHNIVLECMWRVTEVDVDVQNDTTLSVKFNRITGTIDVKSDGAPVFIKTHK